MLWVGERAYPGHTFCMPQARHCLSARCFLTCFQHASNQKPCFLDRPTCLGVCFCVFLDGTILALGVKGSHLKTFKAMSSPDGSEIETRPAEVGLRFAGTEVQNLSAKSHRFIQRLPARHRMTAHLRGWPDEKLKPQIHL